jgi:preprotein translocase subunit SecG
LFAFLLIVLLLVGVFMSIVVLLQAGKGGGLAAMGGAATSSDSLIGGRQAATLLTKATWISGGLFLFLALALSVLSSRQAGPQGSILRGQFQAPAATPTPVLPGTGEQEPPAVGTPPAGSAEQPAGGAVTPQP